MPDEIREPSKRGLPDILARCGSSALNGLPRFLATPACLAAALERIARDVAADSIHRFQYLPLRSKEVRGKRTAARSVHAKLPVSGIVLRFVIESV